MGRKSGMWKRAKMAGADDCVLAVISALFDVERPDYYYAQPGPSIIDGTWLTRPTTIEAEDARHPNGWGAVQGRWDALKAAVQPGDELWGFSSPRHTWETWCGRAGVVLIRGDEDVAVVLTLLN